MKTSSLLTLLLFACIIALPANARTPFQQSEGGPTPRPPRTGGEPAQLAAAAAMSDGFGISGSSEGRNDPGYNLYKAGYHLILDERWDEARKKFAELMKEHPQSEYVDEAMYWSAYALKNTDRTRAIEEYKRFLVTRLNSTYYNDAMTDLQSLDQVRPLSFGMVTIGDSTLTYIGEGAAETHVDTNGFFMKNGSDSMAVDTNGKIRYRRGGRGFSYCFGKSPRPASSDEDAQPAVWKLQRELARMQHMNMVLPRISGMGVASPALPSRPHVVTLTHAPGAWSIPGSLFGRGGEEVDAGTRLKMDALSALGEARLDSLSFTALRDVATDPKQPLPLRETAMDVLANHVNNRKFDVLSVYLGVARSDTNEDIQNLAVDYIGQYSSDKDKSVGLLSELFASIPSHRVEKLRAVLASVAELGNRRAVEFLSKVARTDANYTLRSDAVYYLGNIGGEAAREALYEILTGKQ